MCRLRSGPDNRSNFYWKTSWRHSGKIVHNLDLWPLDVQNLTDNFASRNLCDRLDLCVTSCFWTIEGGTEQINVRTADKQTDRRGTTLRLFFHKPGMVHTQTNIVRCFEVNKNAIEDCGLILCWRYRERRSDRSVHGQRASDITGSESCTTSSLVCWYVCIRNADSVYLFFSGNPVGMGLDVV